MKWLAVFSFALLKSCLSSEVAQEAVELGDALFEQQFGIDLIDTIDEKRDRGNIDYAKPKISIQQLY